MRARCSRLLPFLAVFAIVLAAAPVCAQYVEVPPFTVGTAAADYDLGSTADVAGGADGNFVSVWNETVTTDPTAPLLRAVVSRRSTPLGTVGPIRRWERVDAKAPIEPGRANAIVFALKFRAELYGQYQAGEELAYLQEQLEGMKAFVAQKLGS